MELIEKYVLSRMTYIDDIKDNIKQICHVSMLNMKYLKEVVLSNSAYDFIEKPIDLNRLLIVVRNALDKTKQTSEIKILKRKIDQRYEMIGCSPSIERLRKMIDTIAPTDARVLITGENGTGKEVVARQLYFKSNRVNMPFVEVNCAAIPSELIESELFGHEKGAFTSAIKQRIGKFITSNWRNYIFLQTA